MAFPWLSLVPLDSVPRLCLVPRPCGGCGLFLSPSGCLERGDRGVLTCLFLPLQVSGRQRTLWLRQPQEHICIILWQQANFLEGVFGRVGSRPEGKPKEIREQEARRKQAWAEAAGGGRGWETRPWSEAGCRVPGARNPLLPL